MAQEDHQQLVMPEEASCGQTCLRMKIDLVTKNPHMPEWLPEFIPPTDIANDDNSGGVVASNEGFVRNFAKNFPFSGQIQALCSDTMQSKMN